MWPTKRQLLAPGMPLNISPSSGIPSCRHTTLAASISNPSFSVSPLLHTVPHCPLIQTSNRPSFAWAPSTSLTDPSSPHAPAQKVWSYFSLFKDIDKTTMCYAYIPSSSWVCGLKQRSIHLRTVLLVLLYSPWVHTHVMVFSSTLRMKNLWNIVENSSPGL